MPPTVIGIAEAIVAQREFFARGQTRSVEFRLGALRRLRDAFAAREEAVVGALAADLGKPRFEALESEWGGVLNELNEAIRKLPSWARRRRRPTPWLVFPGRGFIQSQPYGTVLVMSPWNFPVDLALSPMIGAVAAGNTVVVKPSELAPASSQLIAEIVGEAFPPEHAWVCQGGVEEAQALLSQRFDYVFYTGGEAVGRRVLAAASVHLTPCTLELGGKSPAIVAADAPLELAARRILFGRFFNAGQVCIAPDYVLVDQRVHEAFLAKVRSEHARMYGATPCADVGRIVNARHFERLTGYLKEGRILCGGGQDAAALRIHPTVLVDVSPEAAVMREEIFGPILPVLPVRDFDAAVRFVNERPRPLALYLFSKDRRLQEELLERTTSGTVGLNDTLNQFVNRDLPFGGVGASGMGRYHHQASFETFSHFRSVQSTGLFPDLPLKYPPYTPGKVALLRRLLRYLN